MGHDCHSSQIIRGYFARKGHRFIVDLPIENGDFPISYVKVYQRVYIYNVNPGLINPVYGCD
jgi:hypothetical protein